jgi:hypothetical protein
MIYIYKINFRSDGYFGAVSVGLWDNEGACVQKYRVQCFSGQKIPASLEGACVRKYQVLSMIISWLCANEDVSSL